MSRIQFASGWYLISTRSRQERLAAKELGELGLHCILPTASRDKVYCGVSVTVEVPVFPGWLFVRTNEAGLETARASQRVVAISSIDDEIIPEIDKIICQQRLGLTLEADEFPLLCEITCAEPSESMI